MATVVFMLTKECAAVLVAPAFVLANKLVLMKEDEVVGLRVSGGGGI